MFGRNKNNNPNQGNAPFDQGDGYPSSACNNQGAANQRGRLNHQPNNQGHAGINRHGNSHRSIQSNHPQDPPPIHQHPSPAKPPKPSQPGRYKLVSGPMRTRVPGTLRESGNSDMQTVKTWVSKKTRPVTPMPTPTPTPSQDAGALPNERQGSVSSASGSARQPSWTHMDEPIWAEFHGYRGGAWNPHRN